MKQITIFFSLLSTVSCLMTLLPNRIAAQTAINLIQAACARTHNKDHCEASLQSNPDSKNATLPQLAIIALRLASSNATDTSLYIKQLLTNKTLDPSVEQALTDCGDLYMDAVGQLDDSVAALLASATDDVKTWVQAAISDAQSCEEGFKGIGTPAAKQSVLTKRNAVFRQLCNNALAINKLLAQP